MALLTERITSDIGPVYIIGTSQGIAYYVMCEKDARYGITSKAAYPVIDLDQLVVEKLLEHLETENQFDDYQQYAEEAQQKMEQASSLLQAQLKEIEKQLAGLKASLMLPPDELDEETRLEFARKLKTLRSMREAIEKKLNEVLGDSGAKDLLAYQELIKDLRSYWKDIPFVDRKRLATAFLAGVVLRESAPHFLIVDIVWKTPSWGIDSALIWRANGTCPSWTEEENALLREHYQTADRKILLTLLPNRTWRAIFYQAVHVLQLPYVKIPNNTPIPRVISYHDYIFMQEQGLAFTPAWGSKKVFWSERLSKIFATRPARPGSP